MSLNEYDVLISYDVNGKQDEVKEELNNIGYIDSFLFGDPKVHYYLPATTLWKKNTDVSSAKADMISVSNRLKVKLERFVVTKFDEFDAITGVPYKS
jgi:hypothetical protein